jgi:organic hydroperoxide reductase OsmC/OhrA
LQDIELANSTTAGLCVPARRVNFASDSISGGSVMSYNVKISWKKDTGESFIDNKYSRAHSWTFDGGIAVSASSSPHVVPLPMSKESAVDPEEAFVASLSSCHMLWFLSIAAAKNFVVESYEDEAEGILAKNEEGKLAMTEVTLRPQVNFAGKALPSRDQVEELHHLAHDSCFLANAVKTKITVVQSEKEESKGCGI